MRPKDQSVSSILSLIGFVLANVSGAFAVGWVAHAQAIHCPRYEDFWLVVIARAGVLLSLAGLALGAGGVWRINSLRWHAPIAAVGILAFWFVNLFLASECWS
jgi:hypothetical protein